MPNFQVNRIFQFLVCSVVGPLVLGAPWQDGSLANGCADGKGATPQFDSGRNFMGFGCGGNGGGSNAPYPTYHHVGGGNILKNLPPGSNTTLIPLGQVLIPTGKEVCCCTNRNQNGNPGTGMFGNSGASGYGSNMGSGMNSGMGSNMGNYGGCCQTSGDDYGSSMYGQYGTGGGQPYGNGFMPNNGYMGGGGQGSNNGYGYGAGNQMGQMGGGYQTGDYTSPCGNPMDGCCPCCTKKRRRRFVDQLFRRLKNNKRRLFSRSKRPRIY